MESQTISQFLIDPSLISPEKSPRVEAQHLAQYILSPARKDLTKVKSDIRLSLAVPKAQYFKSCTSGNNLPPFIFFFCYFFSGTSPFENGYRQEEVHLGKTP